MTTDASYRKAPSHRVPRPHHNLRVERPRLLVVVTLAETGGAQTFVRSLVEGLHREYSITVAAHGPGGAVPDACAELGVPFHHLVNLVRPLDPRRDFLALGEMKRLVSRLRPDVVQVNSSKAGTIVRLALAGSGIPVVFTAHGWAFAGRQGVSGLYTTTVERVMSALGSAIVCVSDWDRSLALGRGIGTPDRMHVIHNGIVAPPEAPHRGPWPARPLLVCATRLVVPQKDVALLLRALAEPGLENWRVRILGDGPERASLLAQRDALALKNRVEILGDRRDVADHLREADAFVLPSNWEGLPYSILEAMTAALPVVASRVGGVPELVLEGVTGFLVEPGSDVLMASALRGLDADGNRARAFGRAGHRHVREHFSHESMLAAYDRLFRSLITSRLAASTRTRHALQ